MTYGAYLSESDQFGWVTPETTPMHFFNVVTTAVNLTGSNVVTINLGVSTSDPIIPFIQMATNPSDRNAFFGITSTGGNWAIEIRSNNASSFTLKVYIFKVVIPQPLPSGEWGMAIFDDQGRCILTNETNPLRILEEIELHASSLGVPATTKTYSAKSIAVLPAGTGRTVGRLNPGAGVPIFVTSETSYYAVRKGEDTFVSPTGMSAAPGDVTNYFTPYVKTYVIDTSFYD